MGMTTEKVAVVTGAGSGLGRLITIALADQGWYVVAAGRRFELLEDTVQLALPEMVLPVQADVADEESVAALFATVRDRFGRLDLLVNNAGTGAPAGAVDEVTPEGWQSIVATNLTGSFLCAHHAVAMMKAQRSDGRPDHQQRLDLRPHAAAALGRLHGDQARDHRPDQVDLARRAPLQHRLRPDRHRQRATPR